MMQVVSEGPLRITKATIEAAWRRRAPGRRLVVRDAECRGLALVVNATAMTWTYSFKPRGRDPETGRRWPSQSVTIGTPGSHTPDAARDAASKAKGAVKSGGNPAHERKTAMAARAEREGRTVDRMLDLYMKALPKRPRLRGKGGLLSERHVSYELAHARAAAETMRIGGLPVSDVTTAHVRTLLTAEAARPATARHRLGALSRFFDWLQEEAAILANPCAMVGKRQRRIVVEARKDYLAPENLARLWHAAGTLPDVHRDLSRFLLAVPCRRGEAARMNWAHLDLRSAIWIIPSAHAKNRDAHRLHLPALALSILRARWEATGRPAAGLVFPAPVSGKAIDTFADMKRRLDRAVAAAADRIGQASDGPAVRFPAWRWHDLRRSFATALAEAGVAEAVADAVLNHRQAATRGGVLGVYQQAKRWPEQQAAMMRWGEVLAAAIEGRPAPAGQVVALQSVTAA